MHYVVRPGVLDYRLQRFLVGLIAFTMPLIVTILGKGWQPSISASYYTGARNMFVGMLFMVATFLIAYNGRGKYEPVMSKIAAFAALGVALCPTAMSGTKNLTGYLHYIAAAVLFSILVYFCIRFYDSCKEKGNGRKLRTRKMIYTICAVVMSLSIVTILVSTLFPLKIYESLHITFWGETAALEFFGVTWIVAGKWRAFHFLLEEKEIADDSFRFRDSIKNTEIAAEK